jgi:hypothetical protein
MILISHRGNIDGKTKAENHTTHILNAIHKGFDVEIDVRFVKGEFFLGHDEPQYKTDIEFLSNPKLWCHAKNIDALYMMINNKIHCFYHQNDSVTLTSKRFIWTFPDRPLTASSICLFPDLTNQDFSDAAGVCSDHIIGFK